MITSSIEIVLFTGMSGERVVEMGSVADVASSTGATNGKASSELSSYSGLNLQIAYTSTVGRVEYRRARCRGKWQRRQRIGWPSCVITIPETRMPRQMNKESLQRVDGGLETLDVKLVAKVWLVTHLIRYSTQGM
mmetsp:Transcript_77092/g.193890  ORF Transcript_77092/g.193890 Transcript_77092/m.193890 type:complete len:135 (+) Transcript_77092:53-457(+)